MKKYLIGCFIAFLTLGINLPSNAQSQRPGSTGSSSSSSQKPSSGGGTASQRPGSSGTNSTASQRPGTSTVQSSGNSVKPGSNTQFDTAAADAKKRQDSRSAFSAANQTPPPPAARVTSGNGSSGTTYHTTRTQIDVYHHQVYGDRWDYYNSRPRVYVGRYSSPFWYSTYDWDNQRQAAWLYNNYSYIDSTLWQQRMAQNAAVAALVMQMQAQGLPRNTNYVDPAYASNPNYMYVGDEEPVVVSNGSHRGVWISLGSVLFVFLLIIVVYLVFFRQVTDD